MSPVDANDVYLHCLHEAARQDPLLAACVWRLKPHEVGRIARMSARDLHRLASLPLPLMRPSRHFGMLVGRDLPIETVTTLLLTDRHVQP